MSQPLTPMQPPDPAPDDETDTKDPFTFAQSEYPSYTSLMRPHPSIQDHPAFSLLHHYATHGCPVDCSPPWTQEQLIAAID